MSYPKFFKKHCFPIPIPVSIPVHLSNNVKPSLPSLFLLFSLINKIHTYIYIYIYIITSNRDVSSLKKQKVETSMHLSHPIPR